MTTDPKMSRREWFRLASPRTETTNKTTTNKTNTDKTNRPNPAVGDTSPALQDVAHPVNHDGMDLSELPPMREALLSESEVRELFSDISALGSNILLMQRSARSARATAAKATSVEQLRTAETSLLAGTIPRVQIRYHWQQQNWIDTLERREDGFRLIRIAHNVSTRNSRTDSDS